MATHTPAPWHIEDPLGDDVGDALWIVRDGATSEVYDWRCVAIVTSDDPEETDNPLPVSVAERDANARVIAVAPELYEALERLVEKYGKFGDLDWVLPADDPIVAARVALAKARGEA